MVNEFERETSPAKGALGAVLGAAANILVWIVVANMGVPGSITGWIAALLSIKLYEHFGGRIEKSGVIICAVSCLVFLFAADYVYWSLQISAALNVAVGASEYSILDGFVRLPAYFGDAEFFFSYFLRDLVLSYGLCAIGMVSSLVPVFKKRKAQED